jgi:hypothetical protein
VYLIGRTNHHTSRHQTTLAALRDLVGWQWSDQALRNELRKLEPDFHVQRGQGRNRWSFHVRADDFGLDPESVQTDLTRETPSDFEVTSNGEGQAEAANVVAMRTQDGARLQTGAFPQPSRDETSSEGDSERAQLSHSEAAHTPQTGRPGGRERVTAIKKTCADCGSDRLTAYYSVHEAYLCDRHAPQAKEQLPEARL